jgi:hypothetical protein
MRLLLLRMPGPFLLNAPLRRHVEMGLANSRDS